MKQDLSFILDNVKIYTDMCLVRDEIPIFFTCVDENERFYLALCTDMDIPQYCVIRVTVTQLNSMLQGMISMKKIFTLQKSCWIVNPIDNNVENDEVLLKSISDLDEDELPDNDAYFELFSDELKSYAGTISKRMLEGEFISTIIDSCEILNEMQQEETFKISMGIDVASFSVETCDTTEIKKKIVSQSVLLPQYSKEDSCIIVQADYSAVGQKNISNKILIENIKEDLSLAAA